MKDGFMTPPNHVNFEAKNQDDEAVMIGISVR